MRWPTPRTAVTFGSLLVVGSVFGQQSVTVKGVTYVGAELIKEYPQSAYIRHTSGRSFLSKADLSADDAQALGITNHVQQPSEPQLPPSAVKPASIASSAHFAERPLDSVKESQRRVSVETAPKISQRRGNSTATKRPLVLPDQPWMEPMDSSNVRFGLFSQGFLPLKREEAKTLFEGDELSPLSSRCTLEAFTAAKVMLGQLGPEHLPQSYRDMPRRNLPPVARASARQASADPHIASFAGGGALGHAPALPQIRHVSGYDNTGNFHMGTIHPTGHYSGTVHSHGHVESIQGNVSPTGSFFGHGQSGGVFHGHIQ